MENEVENEIENISRGQTGEYEGAVRAYMENIEPKPTAARLEALRSYCASLSPYAVCHAVNVAADNKKSWSYIKAILLRYTAQGIKTKADIERDEARRRGGVGCGTAAVNTDMDGLKRLAAEI